jgi:hypothetical protein
MQYANMYGYSDIHAHEVVRSVSEKTLEVRRMTATLLNPTNSKEPDALQFSPGGFCGHTSGAQRYAFASNESATVFRIRKGKRGWRDANGQRYRVEDEPREHYDFNF